MPVNQPPKGRGAGAQYEAPVPQPLGLPASPGPGFSEPKRLPPNTSPAK